MVRRENVPFETFKIGGHGICDNFSSSTKLYINNMNKFDNIFIFEQCKNLLKNIDFEIKDLRGVSISIKNKNQTHLSTDIVDFFNNFQSKTKSEPVFI